MTVLVTMAGLGTRFIREGYMVPKYKVQARGRSLFEWSMLSLREFFQHEFILATLEGEDQGWLLTHANKLGIKNCKIISRLALSNGQAETAYDAALNLKSSNPLWIYNIDTFVEGGMKPTDMDGFSGCIPVFKSNDPSMSFVRFNKNNEVDNLAEKKVISDWATVGMYGFESVNTFCEIYEEAYVKGGIDIINGERYIAPIYQIMLQQNLKLCAPKLDIQNVHILGTPLQVLNFDGNALPPLGNII
jgi:dTDP-glucose pyrophosphorylase